MIYDFSLASMLSYTGVDSAIIYRTGILKEMGFEVKLIFPSKPEIEDLKKYTDKALKYENILGVHSFFADIHSFKPMIKTENMLQKLKIVLEYSEEEWKKEYIDLKKEGKKIASVILTTNQKEVYAVKYFKDGWKLMRTDFYSDIMYASDLYVVKTIDERYYYNERNKRLFYNRDGSVAIIQYFYKNMEYNIFPDGSVYNKEQLFQLFVRKLNLTKKDIVIIDRPKAIFSAKEIFRCSNQTNIVAVFHSEHYYEKGVSVSGWYLSLEYWYWFKYSKYIHTMIVSTEEQKENLIKTLKANNCVVPEICVIPVMGLDSNGIKTSQNRKGVVCVSRLDSRKRINWTIYSVIKAHDIYNEITLDIYGEGNRNYTEYLQRIIDDNHASDYIKLKGHADVTEIYKNYEVFLTTSLGETFGITLLEATSSGLAMVGLDVRYGNRLFIEDEKNGYLIPYNPAHFYDECPTETEELAKKIVDILSNEEKLNVFREKSFEIAKRYSSEIIKQKWKTLIKEKTD